MRTWNDVKKSINKVFNNDELQEMQSHIELAREIISKRIQKKWTQTELAKKAGLHQVQIARIENGEQMPTFKTLDKIAKALGSKILLQDFSCIPGEELQHLDTLTIQVLLNDSEEDYYKLKISNSYSFIEFKEWAALHSMECEECERLIDLASELTNVPLIECREEDVSLITPKILNDLPFYSLSNNIRFILEEEILNLVKVNEDLYKIVDLRISDLMDIEPNDLEIQYENNIIKFESFSKYNDETKQMIAAASDTIENILEKEYIKKYEFVNPEKLHLYLLANKNDELFLKIEE